MMLTKYPEHAINGITYSHAIALAGAIWKVVALSCSISAERYLRNSTHLHSKIADNISEVCTINDPPILSGWGRLTRRTLIGSHKKRHNFTKIILKGIEFCCNIFKSFLGIETEETLKHDMIGGAKSL